MLATLGTGRFDVTHQAVVVAAADVAADPTSTAAAWTGTPDAVLLLGAEAPRTAAGVGEWATSLDLPVVVRTTDAEVLDAALAAGAVGGHDPSGFADPRYLSVVVDHDASVVVGAPAVPPVDARARAEELAGLARRASGAGVAPGRVVVDVTRGDAVAPGDAARLDEIALVAAAGWPVMVTVAPPGGASGGGAGGGGAGGGGAAAAHAVVVPRGARVLPTDDARATRRVAVVVAELLRARDAGGRGR